MSYDQFWSIFSMPIGLMICFAPLVIAWFFAERKSPPTKPSPPPKPRSRH